MPTSPHLDMPMIELKFRNIKCFLSKKWILYRRKSSYAI
jgi:hypothetical protein